MGILGKFRSQSGPVSEFKNHTIHVGTQQMTYDKFLRKYLPEQLEYQREYYAMKLHQERSAVQQMSHSLRRRLVEEKLSDLEDINYTLDTLENERMLEDLAGGSLQASTRQILSSLTEEQEQHIGSLARFYRDDGNVAMAKQVAQMQQAWRGMMQQMLVQHAELQHA